MRFVNIIGRGGFARVERVALKNSQIVARKVFDPSYVISGNEREELIKRFEREVKIQSSLAEHYPEFFIPVLDTGTIGDDPYYLMPVAERSLLDELNGYRQGDPVPTEAFADIINGLEVLHGLQYVHRDLSHANVLRLGDTWKLSDFGLALPPPDSTVTLTQTGQVYGTVSFMAPEVYTGFHRNASSASDIYALGCIIYDFVEGKNRLPFQQLSSTGPYKNIIEKCTEVDPDKRISDARLVRNRLFEIANVNQTPGDPWKDRVRVIPSWTDNDFSEFLNYARESDESATEVFSQMGNEEWRNVYARDLSYWRELVFEYCNWAKGGFEFSECDVIMGRLETIFSTDAAEVQARTQTMLAAAELGSSHNRWYVMRTLLTLCGKSLDQNTAERIAIEIELTNYQRQFKNSAQSISMTEDDYHIEIAKVLKIKRANSFNSGGGEAEW